MLLTEIKKLASLAWPLLIAQITQTLMGVSDTVMAGRYSEIDMAAVAIGYSITFPMLVFLQGLSLSLSPQVARLHGEKQTEGVAQWVHHALYLVVFIGLLIALTSYFIPQLIGMLELDDSLEGKVIDYVQYIVFCAPAFAVYQVLRNYCEGLSKTRPTMVIMFCGLAVNIPANYIFIYGQFGAPELGGPGCGLATMGVFYTMAITTVCYTLFNKKLKKYNVYSAFSSFEWHRISKLFTWGLPIAFTLLAEVTLFAMAALLLARFGAQVVASHQIALNFSSLIFMIPLSIGLAVAVRIGYLIGEKNHQMTTYAYKSALLLAISTVGITASVTLLLREQIASLYSIEPSVIEMASSLLVLAAFFQFSDAIQVVGANALRGFKDNKMMLIISLFSYWGVGFPTAVILGLTDWVVPKMQAQGFWIGFIVGLSTAAIFMTARVLYVKSQLLTKRIATS